MLPASVVVPLLLATSFQSQSPRVRELAAPDASAAESFEDVIGVRELADGRVLVGDRRAARLVVVDFAKGTAAQVGRDGDGPGEYRSVTAIQQLAGDSTLLESQRNRRWLLLEGTRFIATTTEPSPITRFRVRGPEGRGIEIPSMHFLAGADVFGRFLHVAPSRIGVREDGVRNGPTRQAAEELLVVRRRRSSPVIDTVATLRGRYLGYWRGRKEAKPGVAMDWIYGNALAVEDQALLLPDGWIALVRAFPSYTLEWRRPDLSFHKRVELPHPRVPVTDAEKRAAIARAYPGGPHFEPHEMKNWPTELPPITNDALFAAPGGLLVIARMPTAADPARQYDVVDREGVVRERIRLGPNARIAGFGRRSVYVIERNADDEELLHRHAW